MKILIVDDDKSIATIAALSLRRAGHEVISASGGAEALALAQSTAPDLILLDALMPDMDGHETCRKLKSDGRAKAIPVIFLSANSEPEDIEKGRSLGAIGHIKKPFNPLILNEAVQEILHGK